MGKNNKLKTTEQFIQEANVKHNFKYRYDRTVYVKSSGKVWIYCPIHDEYFQQIANDHLRGCGCPACRNDLTSIRSRSNTEIFITSATAIHGNKYDYSFVEYLGSKIPIKIWCNSCKNFFYQSPNSHLRGRGCLDCGDIVGRAKRTHTLNTFTTSASYIHKNKYDYSKVIYVDSKTPVLIICPCGCNFWQRPGDHLRGQACPDCSGNKLKTKEKFLYDLFEKYPENETLFDYSNSIYKNSSTLIEIKCHCGYIFFQTPNDHMRGGGCAKCSSRYSPTTEEYIEKLKTNNVCVDEYDYRQVVYVNNKTDIIIKHLRCGKEYSQSPYSHLVGVGCPHCKKSKGEIATRKFLEEQKITYKPQKTFENCRYIQKLPFDFCIYYKNNIIGLIEYQGEQHFALVIGVRIPEKIL